MTDLVIEQLDCLWSEAEHSAFTDLLQIGRAHV